MLVCGGVKDFWSLSGGDWKKASRTYSERSKSFSSRIRFSESSLSLLVDGVESCHRQEVKRKFVKRFFFFFFDG